MFGGNQKRKEKLAGQRVEGLTGNLSPPLHHMERKYLNSSLYVLCINTQDVPL